jgi:TATA-binding protein-associated factor Taf7
MSEDPAVRIMTLNNIIAEVQRNLENTTDPILGMKMLRELSKRQKELAQLQEQPHPKNIQIFGEST